MAVAEPISGLLDARSRGRYRDVLATLMRHGASEVLENIARGRISPRVSPRAVRNALCELGPAFIKFGQMLSTREELLSRTFRDELAKLQDETTPFPFADAKYVIERELGGEISGLFAHMEAVPIAVGSIGQVHRASLRDGTEVVVKVQRRGLDELLECDTAIIRQLMLRFGNSAGQGDSAARMVSDFLNDVQSELDYELEANNLQRFAWQFQHDTKTRVPRVVLSHSARHVLTTTYEPGTKLADVSGHTPQAAAAAQSLAKSLLRQIFCFGFFHADPHADNVIAAPDGAIGFYDLGLVGELCVGERECMNSLLLGLLQGNLDATTAALVQLAGSPEALDVAALRPDLQMFIESHRPAYASSVQVTHLLADILRITTKHRLSLPRGFYLAFKALATVDSVGRKLDPAFDLIAVALPLLRRNQSSAPPQAAGPGHLFSTGAEPLWQIQDFSAAMRTTLLQLSQGQLKLQFEHPGLADAAICYERANSRLALALFTAFITLGGYGLLCCFVLAKLATQRQAIAAAVLLALFSGTVVFLIHRFTAYGGKSRGRRRDR